MVKKSIIIAYIWLVGIPLLGLIGILNIGRNLHAPVAVGGIWDINADLQRYASLPCTAYLASLEPTLAISQSGRHLALALGRMEGSGRVENTTVTAIVMPPANRSSCESWEESVYLRASLKLSAENDLMTGVIGVSGCSGCATVSFRATRRRASAKVGR